MKAIYINLDPYLQAVADWINAGKPGAVPHFDPLPLAVTVPLGEDVCIYCPGNSGDPASFVVGDVTMLVNGHGEWNPGDKTIPNIKDGLIPGFSAFPGTDEFPQRYAVKPVTTDSIVFAVDYGDYDTGTDWTLSFPILVRREQASGPVDLVDFTPPPDMRGVSLAGAIIHATGDDETATLYTAGESVSALTVDAPADLAYALGGSSAS